MSVTSPHIAHRAAWLGVLCVLFCVSSVVAHVLSAHSGVRPVRRDPASNGHTHDPTKHVCKHSTMHHPTYRAPFPQQVRDTHTDEALAARRKMHSQATQQWHKLRLYFNWTYVDNPELDRVAETLTSPSAPRACYSPNGPAEVIAGRVTSEYCFNNVTGAHQFKDNCLLKCTADQTIDAADKTRLKAVATEIQNRFNLALSAQTLTPDAISIVMDEFRYCGGLSTAQYDVNGQDMVIYATVRPLKQTGGTVAFAGTCARHPDTDRPTLGHMNVAPDTIKSNANLYDVLLHELTHALGFTPAMYTFYRHPDDRTKTYREFDSTQYETGPVFGAGASYDATTQQVEIDYTALAANWGSTLKVITPNTVQFAKQHFNCSAITGVELENGGNSSASTASHWEMRILRGEYMVARQSSTMLQTGFTLSFFKDMGFYDVDLAAAQTNLWGWREGCTFTQQKCDTWPSNVFCSKAAIMCSSNLEYRGSCDYSTSTSVDIPAPYQYFDAPRIGSNDEYGDFCPTVGPVLGYPLCDVVHDGGDYIAASSGAYGRCFVSDVRDKLVEDYSPYPNCFRMVCDASSVDRAQVRIGNAWYPCKDNGKVQLLYPPHFPLSSENSVNPSAVSYVSFDWYGTFVCGDQISRLCSNTAVYNLTTTATVAFPTLEAIEPVKGNVAGGTKINITGTGLDTCKHLRIGGVWVTNLKRLNATAMSAELGSVESTEFSGGAEKNGLGKVDVELWCNVSVVCPTGCATARLVNGFELIRVEPETFDLSSAVEDFLATPVGKAVAAVVSLVLIIIVLCALKWCFTDDSSTEAAANKARDFDNQLLEPIELQRRQTYDDDDVL
jgi:hypothetical protein